MTRSRVSGQAGGFSPQDRERLLVAETQVDDLRAEVGELKSEIREVRAAIERIESAFFQKGPNDEPSFFGQMSMMANNYATASTAAKWTLRAIVTLAIVAGSIKTLLEFWRGGAGQ